MLIYIIAPPQVAYAGNCDVPREPWKAITLCSVLVLQLIPNEEEAETSLKCGKSDLLAAGMQWAEKGLESGEVSSVDAQR